MSARRLAFLYAPEVERLAYPPACPFKTHRAGETRRRLLGFGLLGTEGRTEVAFQPATRADLERFHTPKYLDALERATRGDLSVDGLHMGLGTPDTPIFRDLLDYGRWACGASLKASDLLLAGETDVAFALLGGFHHAMAEKAAGFCYLNDVVLACDRLAAAGKRVLSLDVDAHHGDGTQAAFYARNDVLTVSFHESGTTLFPWGGFEPELGVGDGLGYNVNVPLPAGTYDAAFLTAFRRIVPPLIQAYRPDVLVLELGMDVLAGDPLTHLRLTNNAHVDLIDDLLRFALPTLVTGGGGYHVENTVRGWALAWQAFAGELNDHEAYGMGGIMLENTDWAGGLRDRMLPVHPEQREAVEPALESTLRQLESTALPLLQAARPRSA
jgi:acetoin utilization protein AcuC